MNRTGRAATLVAAVLLVWAPDARAQQAPGTGTAAKGGGIADSALRDAAARIRRGSRPQPGVDAVGARLRVEVVGPAGRRNEAAQRIAAAGGRVEGYAGRTALEALVPASAIAALERSPAIDAVRPPTIVDAPAESGPATIASAREGEEIAKTNAAAWHAAGYDGTGVKVGIVDQFDGTAWEAARAAGEVPAPAGTFCRQNGAACDIWASHATHGEGVGEV